MLAFAVQKIRFYLIVTTHHLQLGKDKITISAFCTKFYKLEIFTEFTFFTHQLRNSKYKVIINNFDFIVKIYSINLFTRKVVSIVKNYFMETLFSTDSYTGFEMINLICLFSFCTSLVVCLSFRTGNVK